MAKKASKKGLLKPKKIKGSPWCSVHASPLHGNGVFAIKDIPAGTKIIEYQGRRISQKKADAMWPTDPNDPYHTFFFSLSNGKIIDGDDHGNKARWINHSCDPNCETRESPKGRRVYVYALYDIPKGAELFYDYSLVLEEPITQELKDCYRCLCGTAPCRGTMLALPKEIESA